MLEEQPETNDKVENDKRKEKLKSIRKAENTILSYSKFLTEDRWDDRFDMPWEIFLDQVADGNLRIFMGEPKATDMASATMKLHKEAGQANKKIKGEEKVVPLSVIDEEAPSSKIAPEEPRKSGLAMDAVIQTEKDDREGENKLL